MARSAPKTKRVYIPGLSGDGRTEVRYIGEARHFWNDAYHTLLTMPLWAFFAAMAGAYLAINVAFGVGYMMVGGISGAAPGQFGDAFFFSVETISTVGYGVMAPRGLGAHLLMTVESFIGIFNLAISTGLLFARISRPTARVVFSEKVVITKVDGEPTLVLRAANRRRNRIVEAEVSVSLLRDWTTSEGEVIRRFENLAMVRSRTPLFMLSWQIMHRVDELSPLLGETVESLVARHSQLVVVLKGLDETFAQTIHARTSYTPDQIVWGSRLVDIFRYAEDGTPIIDYSRFHDIE